MEVTRKVVLAVDLSEHSEYAFQWYVENFHRPENKLIIATCPEFCPGANDLSAAQIETMILEVNAKTDQIKTKYLAAMNNCGVTGEIVIIEDKKPGHGICDLAKRMSASFIVTGTRGHGRVRRTILGSVSEYILHHSHVPVLICRQKDVKQKT